MRKGLTTFLVILLALGAVLVSCKAEIEAPADELVAVSFEESASRALSATLEEFDVADYFWYYAAKKTDSTGLISGETTSYDAAGAVAISSGAEAKGLSGYTVPGFSQGTWKFTLYAYATRPTTATEKAAWVYSGEATGVVLQKGGTNKVTVTVSPNPEGKGILFVDMAHIYLSEASKDSDNQVSPVVSVVKHPSGTPVTDPPTGNLEYELPTGTYKVTVSYTDGYITYATGYVIATVYPGLTTTVTGYVDELVTYAEFDAKQNPDIVRETWGSTITNNTASEGNISLTKDATESKTTKVTSATMPAKAAVDKMNELATNVGADAGTSSMKLNLNVDTTEATETKVKYDIGMEAILTYTKNQAQSVAKSDVKNVSDYVLIDIDLTSDITGVTVTHSGEDMIPTDNMTKAGMPGETDPKYVDINKGTSADPLWVGFYKLETTSNGQVLHIKTKSFSPFEVTYAMTDYVAMWKDKKYTSVSAAINAATDGTTVILLKDTSGAFTLNGEKTVTLDLAGHSYNGGNMWVIGDSTLKVDGRQSGSSVNGCFCIGHATNNNGNIEIDGGSYSCGENDTVLHINGTCLNSNVTIRNATITSPSDNGIQLNGSGKFLIENTTITGDTAIYVKSGTLTIEGGTFTGDKTPADYSYNGNGANATGDAIVIDACEYPGGNPTVIIKDGTFTGTKAAIGYYQYDKNNDGIKGQATIRVEGGRYNTDPTEFVADGYCVVMDGSYYKVVPAVAKIGDTYYASVAAAVSASEAGDTVIVLRDTVETSTINVNKNITIKGISPTVRIIPDVGNKKPALSIHSSATIEDLCVNWNGAAYVYGVYVSSGSSDDVLMLNNVSIDVYGRAIYVIGTYNGIIKVQDSSMSGIYPLNIDSGNATFEAKNSEFYGWASWGDSTQSITFDNCSFGEGHEYAFVRPYVSTTFINCTFADVVEMDSRGNGGIISFDHCSIGETSIVDEESLLQLLHLDSADPDSFHTGKKAWIVNGTTIFDDRETTN